MVYRVFVEKKPDLASEAKGLLIDAKKLLGVEGLENVRVVNRYDVENITPELFEYAKKTVFSEPQVDIVSDTLDCGSNIVFAVEYLPGQFDQRADSAAQCIQIISCRERPLVRTAKVYILSGNISESDIESIKKYVINPVEAREAALSKPDTLNMEYDVPVSVETLVGFNKLPRNELADFIVKYGLAMDIDDISFCQQYFISEDRDPTITEIRMIDTYWSDHCRHTTFTTIIDDIKFEDPLIEKTFRNYLDVRKALGRTKPVTLMDMATLAVRELKKNGKLEKLDESEEINACTVKIEVDNDGKKEPWLLMFKNETHNHPTEIEPFGGAATCIGGAIRDPLSGRGYVYGAMRLTGAADPLKPVNETLPGKLPQRKLVTTAAAGYSSYGNQIGLATGIVDEIYHPGYVAKRLEVGAVVAAVPAENVHRECPAEGDVVILLGGRTGRDGCGGATGSSKAHTAQSLEKCGAEVQKGNAPEERKLQRLFRNAEASKMIIRCNDFGAGGVSVAVGELADGLDINLDVIPKKYDGLDGTELAISESQERMAVVVKPQNVSRFIEIAESENLEATILAEVTEDPRLVMHWKGKEIANISRDFLNTNGAEKHISAVTSKPISFSKNIPDSFEAGYISLADDLNICSKRGLSERFDSTIGAGTVLMPFGGKYQRTPIQAMVQKVSVEKGHTDDCSLMSWGFNPYISEKSPYHGAYLAVVESICKLIAVGAEFKDIYLSFQEYFERLNKDPQRWGKPVAALLGAFRAQLDFGVGAIGGKDSMSGSFEDIHVPPTLISFAVTTEKCRNIISNEFKAPGNNVYILKPSYDRDGLPETESLAANFNTVTSLMREGKILSAYTPGFGGVAEAILKMCLGNKVGFEYSDSVSLEDIFSYSYGAFVLETACDIACGTLIGKTTNKNCISWHGNSSDMDELTNLYENKLEDVYSCNLPSKGKEIDTFSHYSDQKHSPVIKTAKPKVLIPVFPGTNCEYDSAKAVRDAGAEPEIIVIKNLTADAVSRSVDDFASRLKESQMVFIPGGFSGGDEPDGSGKFITAFFRNSSIKEELTNLLEKRDGLMCGICNGFQALIKLGLVPYGRIIDADENCPTLSFNTIARHQSKIVRIRIASNISPWLSETNVGDIYSVPISHGEGRLLADEELLKKLASSGQIATQYVDFDGNATDDIQFNPNDSTFAVEGMTSPDGRVFGKMGHAERVGTGLYKNVPGNYDMGMFTSAVKYFK